jgi:ERCC4-type nuclease
MKSEEIEKNGLYIDYREHSLIETLKNKVEYKTENMIIGDIIFYKENKINLLIERKTISDLASSIKDGRLRNQTSRILDTIKSDRCIFLIEGSLYINNTGKINGTPVSTLYSTLFNKLFRDNIKIMNSCNIQETGFIIKELNNKFIDNKLPFDDNIQSNTPSLLNLQPKKKGDISEKDCFNSILCQIPSISNIKALSISSKYDNIVSFISKIKSEENSLNFISTIILSNGNKLGVKSAEKIIKFLGI